MSQTPKMFLNGADEEVVRNKIRDELSRRMTELDTQDVEEFFLGFGKKKKSPKDPGFENKHPRGQDGRFGEKGSNSKFPSTEPKGTLKVGGLIPEIVPGERPLKVTKKKDQTIYEMKIGRAHV